MDEVDAELMDSVQEVISVLKEPMRSSSGKIDEEGLEVLHNELAGCKLQLKAKESAYMQALLKLQQFDERTEELSSLLMKSELECDVSMGELREAQARVEDLEHKLKETTSSLSESTDANKQLLEVLKATQDEQLSMEEVIVQERESKNKAMDRAEEMQILANVEKEQREALLKRVEELEELICVLKVDASEAEKEKVRILSEKIAELELAKSAALTMQKELAKMGRKLHLTQELEAQIASRSATIESLQSDLKESDMIISSLKEDVAQSKKYAEELNGELEAKEREISNHVVHANTLEAELNLLRTEVAKSKEKGSQMIREILRVRKEYQSAQIELLDFKDRSTQARVEIATLKADLHRTRLRLAAPEATKLEGMRTGLTLTVQQLAAEVDEVKNEDESLTKAVETEEANPQEEQPTSHEECSGHATSEPCENAENEAEPQITISLEEYKALTLKAKKVDDIPTMPAEASNNHEVRALKRDLEIAQAKVGEFRTRVVQAITRAEAAERAQALAEDQLRSWRERRKVALVALRDGLVSQESPTPPYEEMTSWRRTSLAAPLGDVLNMRL